MTTYPGNPPGVLLAETARDPASVPPRWLPRPADMPPWRTPSELDANYSGIVLWWQRWMLVFFAAFVALLLSPLLVLHGELNVVQQVLKGAAVVAFIVMPVALAVRQLIAEVRLHRTRDESAAEIFEMLQRTAVPVWAVFADRVRVSGGGDSVYDLQFVFDLRVPTGTLELQHRVIESWLDQIATTDGASFEEGFARTEPVHCVDVFGEPMRGVWIWSKASILPFQVLGLSVDDPRTAASLSEQNVAFMRRQPKVLRELSKISG